MMNPCSSTSSTLCFKGIISQQIWLKMAAKPTTWCSNQCKIKIIVCLISLCLTLTCRFPTDLKLAKIFSKSTMIGRFLKSKTD